MLDFGRETVSRQVCHQTLIKWTLLREECFVSHFQELPCSRNQVGTEDLNCKSFNSERYSFTY